MESLKEEPESCFFYLISAGFFSFFICELILHLLLFVMHLFFLVCNECSDEFAFCFFQLVIFVHSLHAL